MEFYDVAAGTWSDGAPMLIPRMNHGMVFLPKKGKKGTVMIAGGMALLEWENIMDKEYTSVEFYDVAGIG